MIQTATCLNCSACEGSLDDQDRYCSSCGTPVRHCADVELAPLSGFDPGALWLGEIDLSHRTVHVLAQSGMYVVADVVGSRDQELLGLRNFGTRTLEEVRIALANIESNRSRFALMCEQRIGMVYDPHSSSLGVAFSRELARSAVNPDNISIATLKLSNSTLGMFRRARILTVGAACGLTSLELIQRLSPRSMELLEELERASHHFLAALDCTRKTESSVVEVPGVSTQGDQSSDTVVDAFQALIDSLETLDARDRMVLEQRFGLVGSPPMTLEEVGQLLGVTRERVRQISGRALQTLQGKSRAFRPATEYVDDIRQSLGLSWRDSRLPAAIFEVGSDSITPYLNHLPLLVELLAPRDDPGEAFGNFEAAVAAVLSGSGPLPLNELAEKVLALLDPTDLERRPHFSTSRRIEILGPAVRREDGQYELSPNKITGFNDRKMRRLQAMARVLEQHGPSHYSLITREVNELLPEIYRMSVRDVHSSLERHSNIFAWAGRGVYGIKSQDIGIRSGSNGHGAEPDRKAVQGRRQRKGIGDEIANFLNDTGPRPIQDVEAHILARFTVQRTSVLAAIKQDRHNRFCLDGGVVSLNASHIQRRRDADQVIR